MPLSKFLDPKNDIAFKRIFGTEKNKDILIHFLNDILEFKGDQTIKKVSFLKTVQDPEIAAKKQSIVDIMCTDQTGRKFIIEMQVARTKGFEKRAQYYAAKAYSSQINRGEEYNNLKEVIFLAITDFVMFANKKAYKSDHVILDRRSYENDLKDFSFTFLELPKFKKTEVEDLKTIIEKWAYFFKHASETSERDLERLIGDDMVIGKAYEEINKFSWSEIELNTYEQETKRILDAQAIIAAQLDDAAEKGRKKGIEQGIEQGMEKGIEKVARNLLNQGVAVSVISQGTGLSVEDIEKLIKK